MDDDEKEMMQKFSDMDDEHNAKVIQARKKTKEQMDQERRESYFKKHGSA